MRPRITNLAYTLRSLPNNKAALYLLHQAVRSTGELHTIAVLMECWSACQGLRPELALLTSYAREVCGRGADVVSGWLQALAPRFSLAARVLARPSLFERT